MDPRLSTLLLAWSRPCTVEELEGLMVTLEAWPTPLLRAFWLALGMRQRFTRARCLHMVRERWGTALRVGL